MPHPHHTRQLGYGKRNFPFEHGNGGRQWLTFGRVVPAGEQSGRGLSQRESLL